VALMIMTSHGLKVVQGLTTDPEQLVQVLKRVSSEQTGMQGLGLDAQANAAVGDIPNLPSANSISANPLGAAAFLAYGDTISASFEQPRAIEETLNGFLSIVWSLAGVSRTQGSHLGDWRIFRSIFPRHRSSPAPDIFPHFICAPCRHWMPRRSRFTQWRFAAWSAILRWLTPACLIWTADRGWPKLKVKVDQKGVSVRAREGFFVTNTTMNPELRRSSDLTYALISPIEGTGVPLRVKWLGTSGEGAKNKDRVHHPYAS
jgi:hypothetical protein